MQKATRENRGSFIYEGVPFEGDVSRLERCRDSDRPGRLPRQKHRARVQIFTLGSDSAEAAGDLAAYIEVCEEVTRGWSAAAWEDIQFVPEKQHWRILLKWVEHYYAFDGPEQTIMREAPEVSPDTNEVPISAEEIQDSPEDTIDGNTTGLA